MGGFFSKKQTNIQPSSTKNNYGRMNNSQTVPQVSQPISKPFPQNIYQSVSQPISNNVHEPVIDRDRVIYPRSFSSTIRESTLKENNQYLTENQETNIHNKNTATIIPPNFVPYEGCVGRWVSRSEFIGDNKTFGHFKCNLCNKTWMSAHSKKQFKQACKGCNQYFLPAYLWVNDNNNYQKKDKSLVDKRKPHRSDLCQACRKGRCTQNLAYQPSNYNGYNDQYKRTSNRQQDQHDYYD